MAAVTGAGGSGPAVEARTLYRFFRAGEEETLALKGVSVSAEPGEFVVVTGPSGSGKSTLLTCLAGLDDPDGGSVHVAGQRLSHRPEPVRARIRAASVGILAQSGNLLEHLSVEGNVRLAQALTPARSRQDVPALLESVGLGHRARARPSELSGGEAARAGLAVALANEPAVLLADEPTGELDRSTESELLGLLLRAADRGAAVVTASHSAAVSAAADRSLRLHDGEVVA